MVSVAFNAALKAFGGWGGIVAFYFVGLAFPICFAVRTLQAHDKKQIRRQTNELRVASSIIFLSATACFTFPAIIYLLPHVAYDHRARAFVPDLVLALAMAFTLARWVALWKLKRTVKPDLEGLALEVPNPKPGWCDWKRLFMSAQRQYFVESTWLTLFTLWFVNISGGLLTICIGKIMSHHITWWQFPLYNIGGHVAHFHASLGLLEAFFHPARAEIMQTALEYESRESREAYCQSIRDSTNLRHAVERHMPSADLAALDLEKGCGISGKDGQDADSNGRETPSLGMYADEKAVLQAEIARDSDAFEVSRLCSVCKGRA